MRLLFWRPAPIDPRKPHTYREPGSTVTSLGGLSAGRGGYSATSIAVAGTAQRESEHRPCAVPGCGRPHIDDLHAVSER